MTVAGSTTAHTSAPRDHDQVLIGGRWVPANGEIVHEIVDPSTEEVVSRVREASADDMAAAVAAARAAFDEGPWPAWSPTARADAIDAIADGLEAQMPELVEIAISEQGAPGLFARHLQAVGLYHLRYYAELVRLEFKSLHLMPRRAAS